MKTVILNNRWKPGHARGRRGRTAALFATVAISVCMAVQLDGVVIDDFEEPVKFIAMVPGMDYFQWNVDSGQLVIARQYPNPTPRSNPLATYDNVIWEDPRLPGGNLEGGRTLELRMDINHISADDLFLLLMCRGAYGGANTSYSVLVDRNEVALMKKGSYGNTTFYWDTLATPNENVTVKLAFAKTNSSLAITVKIVDKGNARATLYQRTFVDGPGRDGPVPPPDPHGLGFFTQDAGVPYPDFSRAGVGCSQMIYSSPPPLEMRLDNLEYDVYYPTNYQPPLLEMARAAHGLALNWTLPMEEHTVVEADQLAGPWCPCPQPYTRTGDAFCLQMPCLAPQKFFQLTPGTQFTDDFSSVKPSWTPAYQDAGDAWVVTEGVLRVSANGGGLMLGPLGLVGGVNPEAVLRDFYASVDTLDLETSGTNWSSIALFGRGLFMTGKGYFGGIGANFDGNPGHVTPWIKDGSAAEVQGAPFDMAEFPPPIASSSAVWAIRFRSGCSIRRPASSSARCSSRARLARPGL